jgi:dethiobiotin synthetase
MGVMFITGIDTDIGKTYATGLAARFLRKQGQSVITQKIIQTGCKEISEDISLHRSIMEMEFTDDDRRRLTCPYLFEFPASPHLAAKLGQTSIDLDYITRATEELSRKYNNVLVEGAGGIYVPLNEDATLLDYLSARRCPIIIVSSSRLGSINHTLMTLDILKCRDLDVRGIIYNRYNDINSEIAEDSKNIFLKYLMKFGYPAVVVDMPRINLKDIPFIDFSGLFT